MNVNTENPAYVSSLQIIDEARRVVADGHDTDTDFALREALAGIAVACRNLGLNRLMCQCEYFSDADDLVAMIDED